MSAHHLAAVPPAIYRIPLCLCGMNLSSRYILPMDTKIGWILWDWAGYGILSAFVDRAEAAAKLPVRDVGAVVPSNDLSRTQRHPTAKQ